MSTCPNCFREKEICEDCQELSFSNHVYEMSFEQLAKRVGELEADNADLRSQISHLEKEERSDWFRGDFHKKTLDKLIEKLMSKNPKKKAAIARLKAECYEETKRFFREVHGKVSNE